MIRWVLTLKVVLQNGRFNKTYICFHHNVIDFGSIGLSGEPIISSHIFSLGVKNAKGVHHLNELITVVIFSAGRHSSDAAFRASPRGDGSVRPL
jgi:hypothetical protein